MPDLTIEKGDFMLRNNIYFSSGNDYKIDALDEYINEFSFHINSFGHQYNDVNASCNDRIIGDFELIYIIDGESYITIEEQWIPDDGKPNQNKMEQLSGL